MVNKQMISYLLGQGARIERALRYSRESLGIN